MKKSITFLFLLIMSGTLVSAYSYSLLGVDVGRGADQFIDIVKDITLPILQALFGASTDLIFEKLLFLVVIFLVVLVVLKKTPIFKDNYGPRIIVTIAVSLLATRFLTEITWVKTVLIPYHVLGIAILTFVPFMIFFYFIEKEIESQALRRIAWCLFAAVFIGIWFARYDEVGSPSWIFLGAAALAVIVMLIDGSIQTYFVKASVNRGIALDRAREMARLTKRIEDDSRLVESTTGDQRDKLIKAIKENEETLRKFAKGNY